MSDANVSLPDAIPPAPYTPSVGAARQGNGFWGKEGFSFANLLDVVNPLQHIPVVGSIYRAVTGDQISPGARIAGGTLFGGPIGFAAAVANLVVEDATEIDIGKSAVAMVTGKKEEPSVQVAASTTAVPATPSASAAAMPAPAAIGAIASAANPAVLQPASAVAPQGGLLAAAHAPAPWSALMAPAQLMPPSATQGHLATATTAGVVTSVQKDAIFAQLAGQAPSASASAMPTPAGMLDAQKQDALFARLAGTSAMAATPDAARDAASANDVWRSSQRPKMTAPIRPKARGPVIASYPVNTPKQPTPTVAAETTALSPTPAAAPATTSTAKLPGGYTAQELLQMYQRYQKPGATPATSPAADSNS